MSGGSYNYLYGAVHLGDLGSRRSSITDMLGRLDELAGQKVPGAARASLDTRVILAHFERAENVARRLEEVWHAVEWRDSGDTADEEMHKVLAEYEGKRSRGQGERG